MPKLQCSLQIHHVYVIRTNGLARLTRIQKIIERDFKILPVGVLALAAEVTMPKLVIASVKPPYTILFIISKLLPRLTVWPNLSPPSPGGIGMTNEGGPSSLVSGSPGVVDGPAPIVVSVPRGTAVSKFQSIVIVFFFFFFQKIKL